MQCKDEAKSGRINALKYLKYEIGGKYLEGGYLYGIL